MDLLLEPRAFRLLEGLRIAPRKSQPGRVRGERLTRRAGLSIEFADYRNYAEGDDLRHLDWNVLARLDSPVMRTYRDEEDLAVHILLDDSPSMAFGEPEKGRVARDLAAAFGYVGLVGGDAVTPVRLGRREPPLSALRGRAAYGRYAAWLGRPTGEDAPTGLATSLRSFAASKARTGVAIVLSDGLDPEAPNALRALVGRGHEVWAVQILSDLDLDPDLEGDLRLIDGEGGVPTEITANSVTMKAYRENLTKHCAAFADAAKRGGGRYTLYRTGTPLDVFVKDVLKREGWVR
ncbi:DUF58 domain-containing protein [bacterium]|nr:MAG: DUF58 domain-containing protein [bacterium]